MSDINFLFVYLCACSICGPAEKRAINIEESLPVVAIYCCNSLDFDSFVFGNILDYDDSNSCVNDDEQ